MVASRQQDPASSAWTRRNALRTAAVGAGTVWVAPLIQAVSMEVSAAASAPPGGTRGNNPPYPPGQGQYPPGQGQNPHPSGPPGQGKKPS
jgi:hypothetical protein